MKNVFAYPSIVFHFLTVSIITIDRCLEFFSMESYSCHVRGFGSALREECLLNEYILDNWLFIAALFIVINFLILYATLPSFFLNFLLDKFSISKTLKGREMFLKYMLSAIVFSVWWFYVFKT